MSRIERLLRPELRRLQAYHVQPAANMIKLDAMENPFALPSELENVLLRQLSGIELNRYPDASADALRAALKQRLAIPASFDSILGNGSDELIQLLCMALIDSPARQNGRPVVMAPEPGFAMYRLLALAAGLDYIGVPLQADTFALDMPAMLQAIEQHRPELLFLAYPNNPTGNLFADDDIKVLVERAPGLVVIDEAYHPFAKQTAINLLHGSEHVLLLRTLSKLGLAGIRLGLLAGAPAWIGELNKLRLPYNINTLTQVTATVACEHYAVFSEQADQIRAERERLYAQLECLERVRPFPSRANFILFRTTPGRADAVFAGLKQQGVLVKNVSNSHLLLRDCLRVTVGTAEENAVFLSALKQSLQ